ncbi:MAG: aspartate-semialdehyde dehydrogenase [Bacillota bacterium]
MGYNVAVVGATGAVGTQLLQILGERRFPLAGLRLLASPRSAGLEVEMAGRKHTVEAISAEAFDGVQLAFFAASTGVSRDWVPVARQRGAVVIDKSNAFRLDPTVPLVVPEVNAHALSDHHGIIASPNCSTIQLVVVLEVIERISPLRLVVVSTYQSVSGTGRRAMEELRENWQALAAGRSPLASVYPHPIGCNVLPHIDSFERSGYSLEEMKLVNETRKILNRQDLQVIATAVRVPVMIGHAESVYVETDELVPADMLRRQMERKPGIVVEDDPDRARYPLPALAAGQDKVYVGRLRNDLFGRNGLAFWVVADNLRKGAATNAVQIAEELVERDLI